MPNNKEERRLQFTENPDFKPVPRNFLEGYIRGNFLWPQKHFATSILVSSEAVTVFPLQVLPNHQFSPDQLVTIATAMNRLHTFSRVKRIFPLEGELVEESSIKVEEVNYLWDRSIFGAANRIVAVGRLLAGLSEQLSVIPNLRDLYYGSRDQALLYLKVIDDALRNNENQARIVKVVVDRMRFHLLDKDLSNLAQTYRVSISDARREGRELLKVNDEEISKEEFIQRASAYLVAKLAYDFPDLDWEIFDHSH